MTNQELIFDWNTLNKPQNNTQPIELCDETLRDGIQSPSVANPPLDAKLELLELMDNLGIAIADIGLPGAGPKAYNDVLAMAQFLAQKRMRIKAYCAARTLQVDIKPIAEIQQKSGLPIAVYSFLGTSPVRQYVEDWKLSKLLKFTEQALTFAHKENLETAFVTEDTIRSTPQTLQTLFKTAISLGCKRLVLCDTAGHATPLGIKNLISFTKNLIKDSKEAIALDWHGHNDRGLAVSNSLFAAQFGCDRIHGTCLGVGERSGNASMDQLIVNFKLLGRYPHDVQKLATYVEKGAYSCDVPIPYNYPICGRDAFRTATGVHAAAIIKAEKFHDVAIKDIVYSGVPAHWFGFKQQIEIGPMSGLSNVHYWMQSNGIAFNEQLAEQIFQAAKKSMRVLSNAELEQIVSEYNP